MLDIMAGLFGRPPPSTLPPAPPRSPAPRCSQEIQLTSTYPLILCLPQPQQQGGRGQGLWGKQNRWAGLLWKQILFLLFCLGLISEFKVLGPNCTPPSSFKKLHWKTSPSHYACYRLMRRRLAECKLSDECMQVYIQALSKDTV